MDGNWFTKGLGTREPTLLLKGYGTDLERATVLLRKGYSRAVGGFLPVCKILPNARAAQSRPYYSLSGPTYC